MFSLLWCMGTLRGPLVLTLWRGPWSSIGAALTINDLVLGSYCSCKSEVQENCNHSFSNCPELSPRLRPQWGIARWIEVPLRSLRSRPASLTPTFSALGLFEEPRPVVLPNVPNLKCQHCHLVRFSSTGGACRGTAFLHGSRVSSQEECGVGFWGPSGAESRLLALGRRLLSGQCVQTLSISPHCFSLVRLYPAPPWITGDCVNYKMPIFYFCNSVLTSISCKNNLFLLFLCLFGSCFFFLINSMNSRITFLFCVM